MLVTLNGLHVDGGTLTLPRSGAWHADLNVVSEEELEGPVIIEAAGRTWKGTVRRSGAPWRGVCRTHVVAGADNLGLLLAPKAFRGLSARLVVEDALAEAGETLAPTTALDDHLEAWVRSRRAAGAELSAIAEQLGLTWRALPDGTVWMGVESWPALDLPDALVMKRWDDEGAILVADEDLAIEPGTMFDGRQVSRVVHRFGRETRSEVFFEEQAFDLRDRLKGALTRIVRAAIDLDPLAFYAAKVVAQNADGTLELDPDDDRLPGLSKVPYRAGVPGVELKVANGARCYVGFDGGNRTKPYVASWEASALTEIKLTASSKVTVDAPNVEVAGTRPVARLGDAVRVGSALKPWPCQLVLTGPVSPAGGTVMATIMFPLGPLAGTIINASKKVGAG